MLDKIPQCLGEFPNWSLNLFRVQEVSHQLARFRKQTRINLMHSLQLKETCKDLRHKRLLWKDNSVLRRITGEKIPLFETCHCPLCGLAHLRVARSEKFAQIGDRAGALNVRLSEEKVDLDRISMADTPKQAKGFQDADHFMGRHEAPFPLI
ncbi:hypothetical protein KSF_109170 [Reticulibacter mediterranei]|uniref:Uncharacterized protein n=1 Tax=Reticulibacter mediterranei TaxID=2778369 RepID=A0A8J3N761_9CHLR|nr:hypothetical protein KSF_109170 [Reticulibacter mediterranei]